MKIKTIGAEAILTAIIAPFVIWFLSFIVSSYTSMADVQNIKEDLKEIKSDVKEVKNFLIEKGR